MNPPVRKSRLRKALRVFLWLFVVVFVCSIVFIIVSSISGTPMFGHKAVNHLGPHGHIAPNNVTSPSSTDAISLATVTAVISAVGGVSSMVLSWVAFIFQRRKDNSNN
jgi:ABC-type Fe3+ transport system permease subunit